MSEEQMGGNVQARGNVSVRKVEGGHPALAIPADVLQQIAAPDRVRVSATLDDSGVHVKVHGVARFGREGDAVSGEAVGYITVPEDELVDVESALSALAERYKVNALSKAMEHAYIARTTPVRPTGDAA